MAALTGNQRISSRMQVQKEFVLLMLLTIAIFAPVLAVISPDLPVPASDYPAHAAYAMSLAEHTPNAMTQHPNILFQLLTIAVKAVVPPISYFAAAALVGLGCYLITAVLLYAILLGALPEMTHHRRWLAAGGALVLLIVCPILVTVFNHSIYMGYVSLNTLHNPTSVLSRPFALVLTVLLVKLFQSKRAIQGALLALALLTIGSILTKPNYILCLVPAVIIVLLVRLQRKQPLHLAIIIPGLIIPAALLMLLNYQVAYGSNTASSVAVAPFAFVALYDPSPLSWLIKLFASLAFPLAIMADRRAWHD